MALIVEDGTLVEDANSYCTLNEARAYAVARGKTLSADDDVLSGQLIQAVDYLEAQRAKYQGSKVDANQSLQFPRSDVLIDGIELAATVIPKTLKAAQIQLAIEISNGVDIMPTISGPFVIEDTTGPLTTKYSEKLHTSAPLLPAVDALLAPLFIQVGNKGFSLSSVRI